MLVLSPGMSPRPGEIVGRHVVADLLGRGAMGEVYRAHDTVLHRDVALKVLARPTPVIAQYNLAVTVPNACFDAVRRAIDHPP